MIAEEIIKKRYRFAEGQFYLQRAEPAVLAVTGEDAGEFLQGQFSQELRAGRSPAANYGFWLNQKGRVEGDAVVVREPAGSWRIFSWSMAPAALLERLERYLIADEVDLADETGRWRAWSVAGPEAVAWGSAWAGSPAGVAAVGKAWPDAMPLEPASGVIVATVEPVWPAGWQSVDPLAWERARLSAGVVRVPVDLGPDDLPHEAGLEHVGVSFQKGCYLGQEVMARVEATGRVRRRLVRVAGAGPAPLGLDVELVQAGKRLGVVRSSVDDGEGGWLGWAMISLAAYRPDQTAVLAADRSRVVHLESTSIEGRT